ncbi:hypothetical protein AVEN_205656-1 [Araneus ventricosus]|uniref:CCHC-type domain-containing protein n=1 Tax=Araneus ventricosus TaxID=182803 RepID=A0A4Y2PP73_ARAVE|nr:hypothetical protein AVEN_205656-1 [Araneus ventricosus]
MFILLCIGLFETSLSGYLITENTPFIIMHTDKTFRKVSPFLIQKLIVSFVEEVKDVKKLKSGDLLIEAATKSQISALKTLNKLGEFPVETYAHKSLNYSRGVISELDLDPLRCVNCQRFGHSKGVCQGKLTCSRCAVAGHSSVECTVDPKCINCQKPHTADSKECDRWKMEKRIQELKITKNVSYFEARKLVYPQSSSTASPLYAQVLKNAITSTTQTDEKLTRVICPPLTKLQPLVTNTVRTSVALSTNLVTSASGEAIPISQLDTSSPVPFTTAISPNPSPNPTNSLQKFSPPRDTNPLVSKLWKTSPHQTAKLQTNSSTASVMNNIATDITNPSQIHTNLASDGKTTEAQCIQNDAEISTSSASEDILEYNMSELEETSEESSEEICTPSPPKPRKFLTPTKYKKKWFFLMVL